jgi:hypothetical protein
MWGGEDVKWGITVSPHISLAFGIQMRTLNVSAASSPPNSIPPSL